MFKKCRRSISSVIKGLKVFLQQMSPNCYRIINDYTIKFEESKYVWIYCIYLIETSVFFYQECVIYFVKTWLYGPQTFKCLLNMYLKNILLWKLLYFLLQFSSETFFWVMDSVFHVSLYFMLFVQRKHQNCKIKLYIVQCELKTQVNFESYFIIYNHL
jgi:hypothetical protein